MSGARPGVPSIELRTVEFVQNAKVLGEIRDIDFRCRGFLVALEYVPRIEMPDIGVFKGVLNIRVVYIPKRFRRRGWFSAYLKLCMLLVDEALVIPDLKEMKGPVRDALLRRGFRVVAENYLMLKK